MQMLLCSPGDNRPLITLRRTAFDDRKSLEFDET
jgi:hypothetical protein